MSDSTQMIQRAASFDWETLLPIIFFILYGVAQFFGSKKKGDAVEEEGMGEEEDPMEKARQIREEIRRKIEQRKQAAEQSSTRGESARGHGQAYDPNQPEARQQPSSLSPEPQPQKRKPVVVHQAQPVKTRSTGSSIEEQLAEQRKRLQEAREKHDAAMAQARKMTREASVRRQADSRRTLEHGSGDLDSPSRLRANLISGLRHPNSLRKAVLYREILDPPLGLR